MSDRPAIDRRLLPAAALAAVDELAARLAARGGRLFVVGGALRDALIGERPQELDAEAFGVGPEELAELARAVRPIEEVGAFFAVLLWKGLPAQLALPRAADGRVGAPREPAGDYREAVARAAERRDFTVNALYWDPRTGELLDPTGGLADLARRRLRHSSGRFAEDPVRVLRAAQLAARLGFDLAPETLALCRTLGPHGLAPERLFEEFRKLLLRGGGIARGLDLLRATGWLRFFPELDLDGEVAFAARGRALDAFARQRRGVERDDLAIGFALLAGAGGGGAVRALLARLGRGGDLADAAARLADALARLGARLDAHWSDAELRRLAVAALGLSRLVRAARARLAAHGGESTALRERLEILARRARELGLEHEPPAPLVLGRHLIALGMEPGRALGERLAALYEEQLDGAFASLEEGLQRARARWP